MTKEELKNKISEHKECCKKLAEEYRQRYNKDNTDKLALNMFYHNVISYNDFETVLAIIEDRNSMMMCFSEPPYLTEETVEVNIKRIADLEKENAELKEDNDARKFAMAMSEKVEKQLREENAELIGKVAFLENDLNNAKAQIEKKKSCVNCRYCIDEKCPWQPKGCGMKHWELRR